MVDVFDLITQRRQSLADELSGLTAEQWETPSLCAGWTVRNVAAHLAMPLEMGLPKMFVKILAAGFDFNKAADRIARTESRPGPELVEVLRTHAAKRFSPPGFGPEAPLTDVFVHGQDIRRPLGMGYSLPDDQARIILDLLVTPKAAKAFSKKGAVDGLQFRATDLDWSHGNGAEVSGTAEALIMTLSGRASVIDELTGDGVATLRARTGA
jgi:uncharacterized protein (TIGR03083 family)